MIPKIDLKKDIAYLPIENIPSYKILAARQNNAEDNWLFNCWGGLGDQVCAEPTLRWAHKNLPWKRFGIITDNHELFSHIDCEKFSFNDSKLNWNEWYNCPTILDQKNLSWEFFSHMLTQAVDYVSINCLRMQLPVVSREINLFPHHPDNSALADMDWANIVVVHPGKHWASKTFPASFWEMVIEESIRRGITPLLVGKTVDENVGYVKLNFDGTKVFNYLDDITLNDLIWVLQKTHCLISNDSSVIHIAASGNAYIGCVATVKHPDYIKHWRKGQWGLGFQNLSKGGLWQKYSISPFVEKAIVCEDIEPEFLASILPTKEEIGQYLDETYG